MKAESRARREASPSERQYRMMLGKRVVGFAAGAGSFGFCIPAIQERMEFVVPSVHCPLQSCLPTIGSEAKRREMILFKILAR
jgi:hypothetical protein